MACMQRIQVQAMRMRLATPRMEARFPACILLNIHLLDAS